jgi:hypothetical protein
MNDPSVTPAAVDADLPPGFLDQYKLAVEMADRASARRGAANSFMLAANTAFTALLGGTTLKWYVTLAGIAFAATWWALLRSYNEVDRAKFAVIVGMEQRLPVHVFGDERATLEGTAPAGNRLAPYTGLGQIERLVPVLFALIYAFVLINKLSS